MATTERATIADLYAAPGKAELVDGRVAHMPPAGDMPNRTGIAVVFSILQYEPLPRR